MSEHEALARFHYGCAARHHKVEIRRELNPSKRTVLEIAADLCDVVFRRSTTTPTGMRSSGATGLI